MEGSKRFLFLFMVFFFSGAVVLMGAHELKMRTMKKNEGSAAEARQMIRELRGDLVRNSKSEYVDPGSMPQRKIGDYLQAHDKKKLNSLLHQLVPPSEE
jgi:hypothetical protein